MAEVPVIGWYQEYTLGTSNKFYAINVTDNGVLAISWGRIGSAGQSKVQRFQNYEDAEMHGKKQLYAKASKGYQTVFNEVPFTMPAEVIDDACRAGIGTPFLTAQRNASKNPEFANRTTAVLQHYDDFNAGAQRLMKRIANGGEAGYTFDELQTDLEALKVSWAELDARHGTAQVSMTLAEQMLGQALMGGTLK